MIAGIVIGVLFAAFIGITLWAWSARTQARFADAAQLPLRDELPAERACCGHCGGAEPRS